MTSYRNGCFDLTDEVAYDTLPVQGNVPEWLSGTLIRNGPALFHANGSAVNHWFDGLAMLHAFTFHQGNVAYCNRFLESTPYQRYRKTGKLDFIGFAQDPCRSLFKRFLTLFFPLCPLPNANVNVAKYCDDYVALTEIPMPVRFDPKTLKTLGSFYCRDLLPHKNAFESAHPHYDQEKKQTINYLVAYGPKSAYVLYALNNSKNAREIIAKVPVKCPSYMHSFSLTEHYAIFTAYPLVVRPIDFLRRRKQGFINYFQWEPERGTHFIVVDRATGKVRCDLTTPPFFSFHHANAYEKGDSIILDIVTYPDASLIESFSLKETAPAPFSASKLTRFEIHNFQSIHSQTLLDSSVEFPTLNPQYSHREHRFLYFSTEDGIAKYDTTTNQPLFWKSTGGSVGEPIFVAPPGATTEDEGLILALTLDNSHTSSYLAVLDAMTLQERARVTLPHAVPSGLHGQFFLEKSPRDG